jgi:hypothetical protein
VMVVRCFRSPLVFRGVRVFAIVRHAFHFRAQPSSPRRP